MTATSNAADVPQWARPFVELVTQPPGWLPPALYLTAALLVVACIHRAHTRGVPRRARKEMISNGWAIVCCGTLAWVMIQIGIFPYLHSVAVAAAVGGGIWWATLPSIDYAVESAVSDYKAETSLNGE